LTEQKSGRFAWYLVYSKNYTKLIFHTIFQISLLKAEISRTHGKKKFTRGKLFRLQKTSTSF